MYIRRVFVIALCVGLELPALGSRPALGDWPGSPLVNVPVCTAPLWQRTPVIVSDGSGGAIIAWEDDREHPAVADIYAQHVLATGDVDPAWPIDGLAVSRGPYRQLRPAIVSDGAGGAIITWHDERNTSSFWDIYAQHVLGSGVVDPAWPVDGLAACRALYDQMSPNIATDGAGGAIIAWHDGRYGARIWDVYAQHVLSTGVVDPAWPPWGTPVCDLVGSQSYPQITADGSGGAVIAWHDDRAGNWDVYAQRVLSGGQVHPDWPLNGRALCSSTGDQHDPRMVADGAGGAVVTWVDKREDSQGAIYVHRVLGAGTVDPGWPENGLAVCTSPGLQYNPAIAFDGAGGAFLAWEDDRTGPQQTDLYVHRVRLDGTVDSVWPTDGRLVCQAANDQKAPALVPDGSGGAIVAWQDFRNGTDYDAYASRMLTNGPDPTWPAQGSFLSTAAWHQTNIVLCTDGSGGAIGAWVDNRLGQDVDDIYCQRITGNGFLGPVGIPSGGSTEVALVPPSPNPARAWTMLRYALPHPGPVACALFDAAGRRVRWLARGVREAGEHELRLPLHDDAGRLLPAGCYSLRLAAGEHVLARKLVIVR